MLALKPILKDIFWACNSTVPYETEKNFNRYLTLAEKNVFLSNYTLQYHSACGLIKISIILDHFRKTKFFWLLRRMGLEFFSICARLSGPVLVNDRHTLPLKKSRSYFLITKNIPTIIFFSWKGTIYFSREYSELFKNWGGWSCRLVGQDRASRRRRKK